MITQQDCIIVMILVILGISHYVTVASENRLPADATRTLWKEFHVGGITAVKVSIKKNLKKWRESRFDINIAVTGNPGVGKSSFINAFRGLSPEDEGAAEVGVIETTFKINSYPLPVDKTIVFWDLPGVGTPMFPRYRYLDIIGEDRFDYYFIISSGRFTENDLWLARQFKEREKTFYFARSKVGQDIDNDKNNHPRNHNKDGVLAAIRNNCIQNLKYAPGSHKRVYLIDNYDTNNYDFPLLSKQLIDDVPELKRKVLQRSIINYSRQLILDKKDSLKGRIGSIAIASGLAGAMPVPGLDIAVDMIVLLEEALHFRKEFGLDDESLQKCANVYQMSKDRFTRSVGLKSSLIEYTASGLITYFAKIGITQAASYTTSNIMKYILPIFGNIASGITSYTTTTICLHNLLDMMTEDALKINSYELHD